MINFIKSFIDGYMHPQAHTRMMRAERKVRNNLGENQVDSMVEDTFPASDPPSTY